MTTGKVACLTLDVELDHHDLIAPRRYSQALDDTETWAWLGEVSSRFDAPITAFVVGQLLESHAGLTGQLQETCAEIGLHSFSHRPETADSLDEIQRGKAAFQRAFRKEPLGYRAPLGLITPEGWRRLRQEGFLYDSSIYPSLRPGSFSHLQSSTEPWMIVGEGGEDSLVELPLAALRRLRIIASVSYVKLFGPRLFRQLLVMGGLPSVVIVDCHLHDLTFASQAYHRLPLFWKGIYRRNRHGGRQALWWLLSALQARGYEFWTMAQTAQAVREGRLPHG